MDKKEYVKVLQDIIKINTENDNEELVAKYLQKLLKDNGIESELIYFSEGRANLVAKISNNKGKTLALSGHMDVVKSGDESKWIYPPFSGHIDNNIIWGRGTSDMKTGLAALVIAFIKVAKRKEFKGTIKLLATVGEEVGELGSKQLTDLGYMDDVDGLLIGEPCNLGVVYAHKGSLNYRVISKGVSAHSSSPELGNNAIENLMVAMRLISEKISDKAKKYNNCVLGKTFNNITLVSGGTQINSIPDHAEFEANARTIPEFDNSAVINELQTIIDQLNKKEGFDLEVKITADQPPVETNPKSDLVQVIIDTVNDIDELKPSKLLLSTNDLLKETGESVQISSENEKIEALTPISVPATTDAAQFIRANKNLELAVYGPGIPMLNHKINERVPIFQYLKFIEVYQLIIERYLSIEG